MLVIGPIGTPGPTRAGLPGLNMPALLLAMASTVEPRMRVWSSDTEQIMAKAESMTLVASHSPPSPTSNTTASHLLCWKCSTAIRKVTSNSVADIWFSLHSCSTACRLETKLSSGSSSSSTWMRSRKLAKCGDTNRPVLIPCDLSVCESLKEVVPLPLVPPTCSVGIASRGRPKMLYSFLVFSRDASCGAEIPSFFKAALIP
mmetsp:Transcript_14735/g.32536  ORF Transcript_14735/g.32536 Transcript_14735/m.32536 type:complete len:202 (-) Transcript_14735:162-767(-)